MVTALADWDYCSSSVQVVLGLRHWHAGTDVLVEVLLGKSGARAQVPVNDTMVNGGASSDGHHASESGLDFEIPRETLS